MSADYFKQRDDDCFRLIEDDIFNVKADVLAFSSHPSGIPTAGCLDMEVYERAGRLELYFERDSTGRSAEICKYGDLIVTGSYALPYYWLFHIVTPIYMGDSYNEEVLLGECYKKCLIKAHHLKMKSIAFPLLGTGALGFDNHLAYDIAREAINEIAPTLRKMDIFLVIKNFSDAEDVRKLDYFTKEYVQQEMAKMRAEGCSEEYMGDMLQMGEEIRLHFDFARTEIAKEREGRRIYKEIKSEKKKFFAKNPDKTDEDFALQKLADVVNGWIFSPNDDYTGAKYERKERSATKLAKLIGVSPSTVTTLTNMTKGLPERDTVIALAIAMKLSDDERKRFIMYRNEEVRYPGTIKEDRIEAIIEKHGYVPKFIDLNAELYNAIGETVIKEKKRASRKQKGKTKGEEK